MTRRFVCAIVGVCAVSLAAACSSSGPSAGAKRAYVSAEASALCAVRSQKFADENAQLAAYSAAIDRSGLKKSDVAALKKDAEHDAELRAAITAEVGTMCG
jgi:hypothetical protein